MKTQHQVPRATSNRMCFDVTLKHAMLLLKIHSRVPLDALLIFNANRETNNCYGKGINTILY